MQTITIYSYQGDADASTQWPERLVYTSTVSGTIVDVLFVNGSIPLVVGDDDIAVQLDVNVYNSNPNVPGFGFWLTNIPPDEGGMGAVDANATWAMSSLGDGWGLPQTIGVGDVIMMDEIKWGSPQGPKMGPYTIQIVVE